MDRGIMLYDSGEQRVFPGVEHVDPEQMHHDMEREEVRYSSVNSHAIQQRTVVESIAVEPSPVAPAEDKERFWKEVASKRAAYLQALKDRVQLVTTRINAQKKGGKKHKQPYVEADVPVDAEDAGKKKRKLGSSRDPYRFELLQPALAKHRVRALDARDTETVECIAGGV